MSSGDAFSIPTPESVTLEFPIATAGSRFVALLVDSVLVFLAAFGLMLLTVVLVATHWGRAASVWLRAGEIALLFLVFWGYFSFFEIAWRGQTPGKRLTRLRVLAADGRPATISQTLIRNFVRVVDAFPGVYALGALCMLLNRRAQRLGDLAAGTIVVHESAPPLPPLAAAAPPDAIPAAQPLTAEDLDLIATFLQRRDSLPGDVRAGMAERIGRELRSRLPPETWRWTQSEAGLEAMAAAARATAGARPPGRG